MLTRRAMLTSTPALALAVATPAAAIACSMTIAATGDDSKLFALLADHKVAKAALDKAKADRQGIADEWRHVWPLAPEEILGGANASEHDACNRAERDAGGFRIMRDKAGLTIRLSKKFRREGGKTCFAVETAQEISDNLRRWRASEPNGKTAKSVAANTKHRATVIKAYERKLVLAKAYEAETARINALTGIAAVLEKIAAAQSKVARLEASVMEHPATTSPGLQAKVDVYLASAYMPSLRALGGAFGFGAYVAGDLKRLHDSGVLL